MSNSNPRYLCITEITGKSGSNLIYLLLKRPCFLLCKL